MFKIVGSLLTALMLFSSTANAGCLLIANRSVTEASISKKDVKLIFLGKKIKWNNGMKIHKARLLHGPTHEQFLKEYIQKSVYSYASFWKLAIVTGSAIPPKSFKSEKDLIKYIAEKEGSVGYISTKTPHEGVVVLPVE